MLGSRTCGAFVRAVVMTGDLFVILSVLSSFLGFCSTAIAVALVHDINIIISGFAKAYFPLEGMKPRNLCSFDITMYHHLPNHISGLCRLECRLFLSYLFLTRFDSRTRDGRNVTFNDCLAIYLSTAPQFWALLIKLLPMTCICTRPEIYFVRP